MPCGAKGERRRSRAPHRATRRLAEMRSLPLGFGERRFVSRALQLFRSCSLARCRRMRGCHGEPQRCLATHGAAVPRAARDLVEALLVAARYERVHESEGERWLKKNYRREMAVFDAWVVKLEIGRAHV